MNNRERTRNFIEAVKQGIETNNSLDARLEKLSKGLLPWYYLYGVEYHPGLLGKTSVFAKISLHDKDIDRAYNAVKESMPNKDDGEFLIFLSTWAFDEDRDEYVSLSNIITGIKTELMTAIAGSERLLERINKDIKSVSESRIIECVQGIRAAAEIPCLEEFIDYRST